MKELQYLVVPKLALGSREVRVLTSISGLCSRIRPPRGCIAMHHLLSRRSGI